MSFLFIEMEVFMNFVMVSTLKYGDQNTGKLIHVYIQVFLVLKVCNPQIYQDTKNFTYIMLINAQWKT